MTDYEHEIIYDDTNLRLFFSPVSADNDYSPLHWHSHLEILFILSGYMTAYINDKKYTLKKDDMLIVSPKELHSTKAFGRVRYILLQIPYDYLSCSLKHVSLIHFQAYFPSITMISTQKKLRDCLFALLASYEKKRTAIRFIFPPLSMNFSIFCTKITLKKLPGKQKKKKTEILKEWKKPFNM